MSSLITALPIVLHHEILSFLSLTDGIEYGRLTRSINLEIMKSARYLTMWDYRHLREFLVSESFRTVVLAGITNPARQLRIFCSDIQLLLEDSDCTALSEKLSLHCCECEVEDFLTYFLPHVIKSLHRLEIHCLEAISFEDMKDLCDAVNSADIDLKEVTWSFLNWKEIPTIPSLTSLHLSTAPSLTSKGLHMSQLPNLRCLTLLDCSSIDDVSCLGHLYELNLINCSNIKDISKLNHNHKILIEDCEQIFNFALSFQYSTEIDISMVFIPQLLPINLDRLKKVRSLTIECTKGSNIVYFTHTGEFPRSLRSLSIRRLNRPFLLPPSHNLISLKLSRCKDVRFDHMSSIDVVHLQKCNEITDFSALKHNKHVIITCCNKFRDPNLLDSVGKLDIEIENIKYLPKNFDKVHEVIITNLCEILEWTNLVRLIELSQTIRCVRIGCTFWEEDQWMFLFSIIGGNSRLEKIVIECSDDASGSDVLDAFSATDSSNINKLQNDFIMEFPFRSNQIVLLRKN